MSVTAGDFNGDGKLDLAVANRGDDTVSVFLANGGGAFQPAVSYAGGPSPRAIIAADLNGDKGDDLIVADESCTQIVPPCPATGSISILISNVDGTFKAAVPYAVNGYPLSVAAGDFNGDGKTDVVVANGNSPGTVSVFLGNGDGTLRSPVDYATATNPVAVTVGDFNGDGKLDLAVAGAEGGLPGTVSILLGKGDGTFQRHVDYTTGQGAIAIVGADLNHDGKLDLAVSNDSDSTVSVLLGNGDGTFQAQKLSYPGHPGTTALAVGDFNADGNLDLAVANSFDNTITLLLGKGDGTFPTLLDYEYSASTFSTSYGFTAADLTGDGSLDLAVGNFEGGAGNSISVLLNTPVIGLFPTALSFGKQVLGTSQVESIALRNPGTAPLQFTGVTVSGAQAADFVPDDTCPPQVPTASGCAVSVTFSPKAAGTRSATVVISDSAPGGSQFISVTGAATLPAAAMPTFSPSSGTYAAAIMVTLSGTTPGTVIYYTTNGSTPTTSSSIYRNPISVTSTETISAIAVASGYNPSPVSSATYTISPQPATPVFSPPGGTYSTPQLATISDATPGAIIYYTIDGTSPMTSENVFEYTGLIMISSSETLQAIAISPSNSVSDVSSAVYVISSTEAKPLQFIPVTPCRVADTRNASGAFGGPELGAGSTRSFDIPQGSCNIPSNAAAYALNVTVVPSKTLNYLTLWPTGQTQPNVSTLNSYDGRVKANAAIVPAGTNGGVSVYVSDATQVILDIDGYFVPAGSNASELAFYPLAPCRIADTRNATGALGGPSIAAGTSRAFPILSSSCNIPSTAKAYSLNVTAVPHTTLNYLTTWPTGQAQPYVSTLNAPTGTYAANAAIVPAGTSGEVSIFVSDASDVILDVNGYFAPPASGGLSLYPVTPCRVIDTRPNAFNGIFSVNIESSACAPPSSAEAYVLNATVVPPGELIYLTLWSAGETQPYVSTLNAFDGAITSNMAIVPTTNGSIDAFSSNPTNLILDISSYFAP